MEPLPLEDIPEPPRLPTKRRYRPMKYGGYLLALLVIATVVLRHLGRHFPGWSQRG